MASISPGYAMSGRFQSTSSSRFRRNDSDRDPSVSVLRDLDKMEQNASLAVLRTRRQAEQREGFFSGVASYWPIGVGLLLGAMAPVLEAIATSLGHWCMVLVFPFVVLALRPEIQVGPITHTLGVVMPYAQFPIEGWLARFILRRRVKLSSVGAQVLLFHFLGITEVWMLSGGMEKLLGR